MLGLGWAVQDLPHGGPVPADQARQPLVGKHVLLPIGANQCQVGQRPDHLVDAAAGDPACQPQELLGGAQGPCGQQALGLLLGAGEPDGQGRGISRRNRRFPPGVGPQRQQVRMPPQDHQSGDLVGDVFDVIPVYRDCHQLQKYKSRPF